MPRQKGEESRAIRGLLCEIFNSAVSGQIRDSNEKPPEDYMERQDAQKKKKKTKSSWTFLVGVKLWEVIKKNIRKMMSNPNWPQPFMQIRFLLLECLFREFIVSLDIWLRNPISYRLCVDIDWENLQKNCMGEWRWCNCVGAVAGAK